MTTKMPDHSCPACGERHDAASVICSPRPMPQPGDITICIACGQAMMFTTGYGVEAVDPDTIPDIHPDDLRAIKSAQQAVQRAKERP